MNQRNHEYAAEYCMKSGFILNLQIHLFASLP
jgi:7-carboxy-7-deazaguanine synthase